MGLKIRTFKEILTSMASWVTFNNPKLNNFRVGSAVRTLLEAVAVELESMYFKMRKSFNSAVQDSIANSFGFHPTPAIASSGNIILEFKSNLPQRITIPVGFRFSTVPVGGELVYFEATEEVLCEEGTQSAVVPVRCTQTGTVGNVPARSISMMVTPLAMVSRVYNESAFGNGEAEETLEEYKKRFTQYIETLARGTLSSIQYGCLKVPGVSGAYVSDNIGEIQAYVHDSQGNLPEELRLEVIKALIDYRPAGTEVIVLPVTKRIVNVNITITLRAGFDRDTYRSIVQDSVTTFLNNFSVSRGLTRADLITHIMMIDRNAITNVVTSLNSDVNVASFELIRAGTVNVSVQ